MNPEFKTAPQKDFYTSVSIRLFNTRRLKNATQRLKVSESEVLMRCLLKLLKRLRTQPHFQNRARTYNKGVSRYMKISIYINNNDYAIAWANGLRVRMSNSYLCDMALVLYLKNVVSELEQESQKLNDTGFDTTLQTGIFELPAFLGSYQRNIIIDNENLLFYKEFCKYH